MPAVVWHEHWFKRLLRVLPLAAQVIDDEEGETGCYSWGIRGWRRITMGS